MSVKTTLLTLAAATALLGFSAVGAFAGSASMSHDATLYAHPGWGDTGNSADDGDDVWVRGCVGGFCFIKDDGNGGWVRAWALDFNSDDGDDDDDGGGWHHHHHHRHGGF
jgi:hypothetical protein